MEGDHKHFGYYVVLLCICASRFPNAYSCNAIAKYLTVILEVATATVFNPKPDTINDLNKTSVNSLMVYFILRVSLGGNTCFDR